MRYGSHAFSKSLAPDAAASGPLPANDPPSLFKLRRTGNVFLVVPGDGEKLSVYDADGSTHVTSYTYDGFNRLTKTTYPDGTADTVTGYDANSNMLTRTNRSGSPFSYTYDPLNRLVTETDPAYGSTGANTITTAYDLGGRVDEVSDTFGNILAPAYDTAGRQTQTANTIPGLSGTYTTKYELDANGNRLKLTWPDGYYATYGFETMNRMVSVTAGGSTLATYTYDPYSRRTNLAYPNGASIAYTYSPGSDLLTLTDGFVTTTNNSGYTLGYSNAHQLASEVYSNPTKYDFGPPTTVTGTATYATVNTLNQYPSITPMGGSAPPNSGANCQGTAQAMSYDCNGNLTFDGVLTYTYNPQNRLMLVQNGTTQVATYVYDGVDRRVTKTVGSTVTNFLDDGEDEIAEYGPTGTVLRRFVPGRAINDPIAYDNCVGATAPNCTGTVAVEYFHSDHHGSVVAMSAASGSQLGNPSEGPFTYDVYGNSPSNMGGVPFRYVGMYYDAETGLYYDRARYYSPALGRFMQDDALLYKDDLDLYTYVYNDPTDKLDPDGKEPVAGWIIDGGIGAYYGALGAAQAPGASWKSIVAGGIVGGGVGAAIGFVDPTDGIGTGALVGGASSLAGNLAGQGLTNVMNGKAAFSNIDTASAVVSTVSGVVGATGGGVAEAGLSKVGTSVAQAKLGGKLIGAQIAHSFEHAINHLANPTGNPNGAAGSSSNTNRNNSNRTSAQPPPSPRSDSQPSSN